MEQSKLYYTPKPEDLYIGYSTEWLNENQVYEPLILDRYSVGIDLKWFRTKYLDKEDIDSMGWTAIPHYQYYLGYSCSPKQEGVRIEGDKFTYDEGVLPKFWYSFEYDINTKRGKFFRWFEFRQDVIYDGEINSINELKKIAEWLCIQ